MKRTLLFLSALLLLGACTQTGGGASSQNSSSASSSSEADFSSVATPPLTQTYTDPTLSYSIKYPAGFAVEHDQTISGDEYRVTNGTSFVFPASYAPQSTLVRAEVDIGTAQTCPDFSDSTVEVIDGYPFDTGTWTNVKGSNLYEASVYKIFNNNKCYIATLLINSCDLGADCSAGHTKPFKRIPMKALFSKMMQTFNFSQ